MSILGKMINRIILDKFGLQLRRTKLKPFENIAVKGNNLVGVEIGVLDGKHALSMLKNLNLKKLYLIDPYENYDGFNIKEEIINGKDLNRLNKAERNAKKRLRKYEGKIVWIKGYSSKVLHKIPNNLDFVYIDGAHDYQNVKQDIENYYPKVKVGGIIGGHDIENGNSKSHEGLTKAVLEFTNKFKFKLMIQAPDWWVRI